MLKKAFLKNSTSYSIIKDVYRNGKKTSKVVKALGSDGDILKKHPGVDPYTSILTDLSYLGKKIK